MYNVINLSVPFFGLIVLGFFGAKMVKHHENGLDWLNTFVVYFALPALFFKLLSKTPFAELTNYLFIIATTTATFIIFGLTVLISIFVARKSLAESAIRGAAASYGNVGYMGLALAVAVIGPAAAVPATLIICFDNMLFFSAVPLLVTLNDSSNESFAKTGLEIIKKVAFHPFIISSILGILAAYFEFNTLPIALERLLNYLSDAAAPCALFALGITMAGQQVKRIPMEMPWLIIAKLIIQPIIAFFIVKYLANPKTDWLLTAVLLASLPPAANVFVLANQYRTYVDRASSTILIGTITSVLSVTALIYLIQNKIIPF